MIRPHPRKDRRAGWVTRRQWRRRFIPFAILDVEEFGRVMVICQIIETRWSDRQNRRLWRVAP